MTKSIIGKCLYIVLLMSLAPITHAHSGHAFTEGFLDGLVHPLTGIDHLVAMIGLGLWAGRYHSRQTYRLPLLFSCAMLAGAILFLQGNQVTGLESGILFSIPVLLLLTGRYQQIRNPIAMVVAIVFGMIHGAAHGVEITIGTSAFAYLSGVILVSMILQGIGISLSYPARWLQSSRTMHLSVPVSTTHEQDR